MSKTISVGLAIIWDNKLLLIHPTNSKWYGTYSFPKGNQEKGETFIETALRETKEEVGLTLLKEQLQTEPKEILYKARRFIYYEVELSQKPILTLQPTECDWAGFVNKKDAEKRIYPPFKPLLNLLK